MNRLEEVYTITKQLEHVLDQPITSKNRENVIKQINELIDQRGEHLHHLSSPFTGNEKIVGKKLVLLNKKIQKQMLCIFQDLKQEMKLVKKKKKSNQTYVNLYNKIESIDGMFMDSKQ
ncbi:flagellar protein [Virgibacillus alimentarius]|uniref:Flagellar protein FliT n=1 Tax=Virgibacillus alimentarius TaxID=698769 RepID=A0ABS4S5L8_9BACI|nr:MULTISPECIES: flagellar protein [Virgibacillus]MBP2256797.1 flagellar protein FliT [Virgibacillus alimentarius]HLR65666.1 flagellar protein FliT [Virgibacillus sp.]